MSVIKQLCQTLYDPVIGCYIASNPGPENANLKLAYTNILSIRNKHGAINDYISANNTDILALAETWIFEVDTDSFLSEITPTGYALYHRPRVGKTGGGVGFLVPKSLKCNITEGPIHKSIEYLILKVKLDKKWLILCVFTAHLMCWFQH